MWRTLSTANIKGIGKTVTLAQALFSLLGYTFFVIIVLATTITETQHHETRWKVCQILYIRMETGFEELQD